MIAKVYDRSIFLSENDVLVAKAVEEYTVQFEYSEAWDDYAKTAVFKNAVGMIKEVIITNDEAIIPWEVMDEPGFVVIGVYGINGTKFRPTVWSEPQTVYEGAEEGDPTVQPETTPWQEAVEQIASDLEDSEAAADRAEAAAESISGMTATATTLPAGSSATASFNETTKVLSLGIPAGAKGDPGQDGADGQNGVDGQDGADGQDGYSPTVDVSKLGRVTTITITDKNGEHVATIYDGEDGGGGTGDGDMKKSVYDTNNDGVVDAADLATNASKLGNQLPAYYAKATDVPTKVSDLTNDSGYITSASVPTKTSDLTNDSGFVTSAALPTKTSDLTNDSGFITSAAVPTKTSDLTNDSGFITANGVVKSVNGNSPDANGAVTIPIDSTPTASSTNPVQSGGVASAISDIADDVSDLTTRVGTAESDLVMLTKRQSATGTFNAAADTYISSSSDRTFNARRVGQMLVVYVMFVLTGTTTTSGFTTVGTLPENFYPAIGYAQNIPVEGTSDTVGLRILSSGELQLRRLSPGAGWVRTVFSVPLLPSLL